MKSLFAFGCVSLSLFAFGCSGSDASGVSAPAQEDGSEDALTTQLVSGAVAAEIDVKPLAAHAAEWKVTVAQDKKMKKLMAAFKKAPAGASPPHCMAAEAITVRFLDDGAKELASLTQTCGFGTLEPKSGAAIDVQITGDLRAVASLPLVPSDALWGISKIEVSQLHIDQKKSVTAASEIAKLIGAIDGDQKIDEERSHLPCAPKFKVGFLRKNDEVAHAEFLCNFATCDADPETPGCGNRQTPRSATAQLGVRLSSEDAQRTASGAIELDPRPFASLF